MHNFILAIGLSAALITPGDAGEKPGTPVRGITRSECEQLIKQLVYPDDPPFNKPYVFPEDLDLTRIGSKQARVKAAYDKLSDNVDIALPILAEHTGDKRLSFVFEDVGTSGVITKASVGLACYQIISAHVEVYRNDVTRHDFASIPRCPSFIEACGGIDKWWEHRKAKKLAELQLEALEWMMEQEKPKLFDSKKEWLEVKKSLKKMADSIRASGQPIPIRHHVHFFGK